MKKTYSFIKTLVLSDNADGLGYYKDMFNKTITDLDLVEISKIETSSIHNYNLILIDISKTSNISSIDKLLESLDNIFLILVTPIDRIKLNDYISDIEKYDLILTKPVSTSILLAKIYDYIEEINENLMIKDKNKILIEVLNQNPKMVSIYDLNEKLYFANKKFQDFHKITSKEFNKENFSSFFPLDLDYTDVIIKINELKASNLVIQKKVDQIWIEYSFFKTKDGYLVSISSDITLLKEKERKLEESAIFFEHSEEGILITNNHNKIVSVNNAFCKITGYTKEEVIGKNPSFLSSSMHDENFYKNMWESLKNRNSWTGEIWNKRKNGEIYPQWLSISRAKSNSNLQYHIAIFTDLTSLKEADKKIYYYANHDPLTGLLNRANFEKNLTNSIYNGLANKSKFAVYFIDIDNFKYINDTYGHDIGDEIIIIVGKRLSNIIRTSDILSRIGGDEFTLIQSSINDKKDITALANKILQNISEPIILKDKKFNITLSIGISIYPTDAKEKKELLKKADTAMYVVKENGRNGFKLFEKQFTNHIERQFNIQNKLKEAIEKELIYPVFQPIYDLKTNNIVGCEILARWYDNDEGQIPPSDFIKYAEQTDLIFPLTDLIFNKACEILYEIKKENFVSSNFKLAINISGKYFYDKNFVSNITRKVKDYKLKPTDFELELTETYLMSKHNISSEIINSLESLGFSIALDDFGTGYSSLNYLKHFKINKLKIDKSFVDDCQSNGNDLQIVKTIIQMGKILGFIIHAEGVELKEQKEILTDLGCDLVQGYYFSKPLTYDKFKSILNDKK